ncbi:hypothetical protein [Lactobacillus mulieris]|nr:hypothetical protein [Lactobacillus mulieris]
MSNERLFLFKFLSVYSMPLSIVLDKWDFDIASDVKKVGCYGIRR